MLQQELTHAARKNLDVLMPGYTHLQRAQPVRFAHHLLAYYEMFERDRERLSSCLERINVLPLGAGALAGTSFPIDRHYVAKLLHFPRVSKEQHRHRQRSRLHSGVCCAGGHSVCASKSSCGGAGVVV